MVFQGCLERTSHHFILIGGWPNGWVRSQSVKVQIWVIQLQRNVTGKQVHFKVRLSSYWPTANFHPFGVKNWNSIACQDADNTDKQIQTSISVIAGQHLRGSKYVYIWKNVYPFRAFCFIVTFDLFIANLVTWSQAGHFCPWALGDNIQLGQAWWNHQASSACFSFHSHTISLTKS